MFLKLNLNSLRYLRSLKTTFEFKESKFRYFPHIYIKWSCKKAPAINSHRVLWPMRSSPKVVWSLIVFCSVNFARSDHSDSRGRQRETTCWISSMDGHGVVGGCWLSIIFGGPHTDTLNVHTQINHIFIYIRK